MKPNITLLLLLASAPLAAQDRIALLEGSSPSSLSLRVLDEANPLAPGQVLLQQMEFLPLEMTNRTEQQALQHDRSRLVFRQGLWRVELPDGGRLFHYRRQGGAIYGYLLIHPHGDAEVLGELPGIGVGSNTTPFGDRIAVASDGKHAAMTLLDGSLFLVRLDGGTYPSGMTQN